MEDRELLEMATAAAGLRVSFIHDKETTLSGRPVIAEGCHAYLYEDGKPWNPLSNDGDALRLLAAIYRRISPTAKEVLADSLRRNNMNLIRRTITCAAAEIGKTMQEPNPADPR
jgi:hypothetical protein